MNNIITVVFSFMLLIHGPIKAQNSIENILSDIEKNNKSLATNEKYWESQKIQYKTGLTPQNPLVEFEYMKGTPNGAGNQIDFFVLQEFDFPTSYGKKKQVSMEQVILADILKSTHRQKVLLKAKQTCLGLIYENKKQDLLKKRLAASDKILKTFQTKMDHGDASVLEVNKAKLQRISIQNEVRSNESSILQLTRELTMLNGGIPVTFSEKEYPLLIVTEEFEKLEAEFKTNDLTLKSLEQTSKIIENEVKLKKAMALPKMEAGYHSQAILGQSYKGIHFGLTLPLWESRNTVKQKESELVFMDYQTEEHRNQYYTEILQQYGHVQNLKQTLNDYENIWPEINNQDLLDKAIQLGEISSLQYFMEISYFYTSYDNYLQLEQEYHQAVTELNKFKL